MKEETNATANTWTPTEEEMDDMHRSAWLNYHADAQEAKQHLDRRYARMVNHFGSYKQMPQELKEMFKDDYAQHKAKWCENGAEQQKRFRDETDDPTAASKDQPQSEQAKEQDQLKQDFLQKIHQQQEQKQTRTVEYER